MSSKEPSSPAALHRDVCIIQPGYLPWLGYFDQAAMADVFVLYDDVQFDRGGWRNRNRILHNGAPNWLTVPVHTSDCFGQLVKDVRIADDHWQKKHQKSIRQTYAKAPYFEWCFPVLDEYLSRRNYGWLVDLNVTGHEVLSKLIGIPWNIRMSSSIGYKGEGRTARLVSICASLGATRYISSDASADYMEPGLWTEAGIELVYQRYPHPRYPQFTHPFVSFLSAVDALMFAGPDVRSFVGISHSKIRSTKR